MKTTKLSAHNIELLFRRERAAVIKKIRIKNIDKIRIEFINYN